MSLSLESQIEALLFFKAEPISIKKIGELLHASDADTEAALQKLGTALLGRGVRLQRKDDEIQLATAPQVSSVLETLRREEMARDLGKAGLETLAIVLYEGPISRREIDYIRGVNSSFILRNLLVRGLVERVTDKNNQRIFLYRPTFELLSHLGLARIDELPEYAEVKKEIETLRSAGVSEQHTTEATPA